MPIEIREIIIKTDISTSNKNLVKEIKEKEVAAMKKQILDECKRMIAMNTKKTGHKR